MAGDDRKINLDLFARDHTKSGTDSAARNLDKYGKAADESAKRVEKLNRESDLLERELESLARAFADTEDAAERADLGKGIRRLENDLRQIRKNKGILEGIVPDSDDDSGKSFGRKLITNIGAGIGEAGAGVAAKAGAHVGPVIGGAIGAAAAPVLISALGSALSAGAGIGVLGAGIALAVKGDKGIQAAGSEMGKQFVTGLQNSAVKNFSGPIRQSLSVLEDAGERIAAKWDDAFSDLAGSVVPLTSDLAQAGERISDSLTNMASSSGPAIDGLGDSIRLISDGVGDFLDVISDGSPQAASNLRLVAGATADLARISGNTLDVINKLGNNAWITGPLLPLLREHYKDAADASDNLKGSTEGIPPAMDAAAGGINTVATATAAAKDPMDTFIQQLKDSIEPGQSLYDSQTDVAEAIEKANEAAKKNGETTDANTKKGRDNREALSGLATALRDNYTKYVQLNGASGQANVVAEQNRAAFIRTAAAMTGSAKKAEQLADEILGIPKTAGTKVNINAGQAIRDVEAYIAMLRRIPSYKRTVIETARIVTGSGASNSALDSALRKNARAEGGPVTKGEAYVVGEKRAEVFVPDRDGQIIPSIQDYARRGGMTGGRSGGGSVTVNVQAGYVVSERDLANVITSTIDELRRKGRI